MCIDDSLYYGARVIRNTNQIDSPKQDLNCQLKQLGYHIPVDVYRERQNQRRVAE